MKKTVNSIRESFSETPHAPFIFFLFCWAILSFEFAAFYLVGNLNYLSVFSNIMLGVTDALLILSPYFLLKPKWRWSVVLPMAVLPVFLYANIQYIRNFNDTMGFTMMFGVQNATNMIWSGVAASMRWVDLCFAVPFLIFFVGYFKYIGRISKKREKFPVRFKWVAFGLAVLCFIAQQLFLYMVFRHDMANQPEKDPAIEKESFYYNKLKFKERRYNLQYYGFFPYISMQIYNYVKPKYHEMRPDDVKEMNEFLSRPLLPRLVADSVDNKGKNVILVIVESLNSTVLDAKVKGSEPALPYLTSLLNDTAVIMARNMVTQVGIGRSSDGQLMYQTGLLPLNNDAFSMKYPDGDYPSLAKAMGVEGLEFNPGPPMQWNHIPVSKSFGNQFFGGVEDESKVPDHSLDAYLFNRAIDNFPADKRFVAVICTVDSHDPYVSYEGVRTSVSEDSSYLENEQIYLEKMRQFDRALEKFMADLKAKNLYDNSVIFIVSDHNVRESTLAGTKTLNTIYIPFIAINSGIEFRTDRQIGQIDVFPTILDVMGEAENYHWKGFGTSMLRNPALQPDAPEVKIEKPRAYPSAELWRLSEEMVSGGAYVK